MGGANLPASRYGRTMPRAALPINREKDTTPNEQAKEVGTRPLGVAIADMLAVISAMRVWYCRAAPSLNYG
jgi:hypothetical protein